MAISLPDARQLSDEVLEALRLRALRGCELGFTEADVAAMLGVSQETVSHWWTAYATGGLDAIPSARTGRPVGTGRTLSDEQARHIQNQIDHQSPEELGIPSPLWSRRAVRDLIRQEFSIAMPVRTVGEYLRRWGYTAKRPRRHARQQDPEEVRRWLEETYPAIEKRAAEQGAAIYWCDETGVAADEHPRYGYARKGCPATMEVPDTHIRMNQISAISNAGTVRFMTYKGSMDGALFTVFLGRLLRTVTRKILLIVDRLKAHEKRTVANWVEAHKDRIEVIPMPARTPELNPDEYLNNDLKGNVNEAGLPANKEDLRSRMQRFMRRLFFAPKHVMNYFLHPCVQYAAGT
ncbi:MAG: IS630 family transposase [Planctomycetaceae bacterium]|nr:IS630 family transposase [Planctomycetaceae bacterium]